MTNQNETTPRPETLSGATYKVKTPLSDCAYYVTINDLITDAGTDHEARRPYECFINTKDTANFEWIVSLTRMISAVWRNGGEAAFVVDELKSVHSAGGGFWDKAKFYPSLPAKIGGVIEQHLIATGVIKPVEQNSCAIPWL